jgi:hypothetical protein
MPEKFKQFLQSLNGAEADALWAWFDGEPGSVFEVIDVLRPIAHKAMADDAIKDLHS